MRGHERRKRKHVAFSVVRLSAVEDRKERETEEAIVLKKKAREKAKYPGGSSFLYGLSSSKMQTSQKFLEIFLEL